MKNNGIFQILKKGNKYRIVYIEKGEKICTFPNKFSSWNEANNYKRNHLDELEKIATEKRNKKIEKAKKKEERKKVTKEFFGQGWVKFTSGALIAAMLLTGGHFAGKGIAAAVKNKDSKKPTSSQTDSDDNPNYEYNYDGSVTTVNDEEYVELTTEEFEKITSLKIKELKDKGINLSSEDVIKYMMVANCDKLAQDNRELMNQIMGDQNADEIQQDAYKVVSAITMYNYNVWYKERSTLNFIKVSDTIFDKNEREKAIQIEKRISGIERTNDENDINLLVNDLLKDMLDPTNELYTLESGTGFALQVVMEPIRGLYGMDEQGNNLLNEQNTELIKYFVPYAGDEQKYIDNNWLTGYILGINDVLTDCPAMTRKK